MLSTAAFNALLKIMEEPPSHVIFILATTEIHKVPATIPVSYTHLDVYKRQLLLNEVKSKLFKRTIQTVSYLPPVSYTHLDVYKRQTYGIALWKDGGVRRKIEDISTNKHHVKLMAGCMNRRRVASVHFEGVVEDMLACRCV